MIKDSKRREVARKLRDAAERDGSVDFDGVNSLESCVFGGITCSTWASILYSLADLVDRPTCENYGGEEGTNAEEYEFACTACGFATCGSVYDWNYCPSCGAEVML